MNKKMYQLMNTIEEENNKLISSKIFFILHSKSEIKAYKIICSKSKLEEVYYLEKILYRIRNNKRLNKYLTLYNDSKVFTYLQKFIDQRNKLSKKYGYIGFNNIIRKKLEYNNQNIDELFAMLDNNVGFEFCKPSLMINKCITQAFTKKPY